MNTTFRSRMIAILAAAMLLFLAGTVMRLIYITEAVDIPDGTEFIIMPGESASAIAARLEDYGLVRSDTWFCYRAVRKGRARRFKAGAHYLAGQLDCDEIAALLVVSPPVEPDFRITVIEGLFASETAALLSREAGIDSLAFISAVRDSTYAARLGVDKASLEGYLYPDTYFVRAGTGVDTIIRRMVGRFREVFVDSLREIAAERGMTVHDTVTLASIIETEAGSDDRALVSSVFHHRLSRGLPLAANATLQYIIGRKRRILDDDLDIDSPYNTYLYPGLPPGPISSPGLKSLLAALYPAESDYLYFVSDGVGGHVFSRTLAEHNRAVRRYKEQRIRSRK